jgi:hypothetical protein
MATDVINAKKPSNLSGMEHQITCANKNYHFGLLRTGVTGGLAGKNPGTERGIQGRKSKSGITGNKQGTSKTTKDVRRLCRH